MKTRTTIGFVLTGVILSFLIGCSSLRTHNDYDPEANFGSFKTFAWAGDRAPIHPNSDLYVSSLTLQRIERAIESELTTKGFEQLESREKADFLVSFTVGARDKVESTSYPVTYQDRWIGHWPYYGGPIEVHSYTEGMLAIDISDRSSGHAAWHGVARKNITGSDIDNSGPLIREAVTAILLEFPPQ